MAERVSAATLAKMIRQKETFLPAFCTHIATHTRHWERQGLRLCAKARRLPAPLSVVVRPPLSDIRVAVLRVDRPPVEEAGMAPPSAHVGVARPRSWSCPSTRPCSEQESLCARHGDIQKAPLLFKIKVGPGYQPLFQTTHDRGSHRDETEEFKALPMAPNSGVIAWSCLPLLGSECDTSG